MGGGETMTAQTDIICLCLAEEMPLFGRYYDDDFRKDVGNSKG